MTTTKSAATKGGKLGTMICFHPRYRLGRAHDFEEPADFLAHLVEIAAEPQVIVDYVLAGKAKWVQLQPNLDDEGWEIICDIDKNGHWDTVDTLAAIRGHWPEVAGALLYWLDNADLFTLAHDHFVMLPVILPDASTPYLQAGSAVPVWGEGQIGWMVATKETVLKRLGVDTLDDTVRELAEAILKAEVESRRNPQCRYAK